MFEAAETGSGEALKKSGSNLMTFLNIRQDTLSAVCFTGSKQSKRIWIFTF